jgi:hypothetical protein
VHVRPLVERMVEHARRLSVLQDSQRKLVLRIGSNGGDLTPTDVRDVQAQLEREAEALRQCVAAIEGRGAIVKDYDSGLVDFPSERDGRRVLLCWRLGEDEVGYWHGEDAGFAGRQPLD